MATTACVTASYLRAWVLTIAKNVAVDVVRRARPTSELPETRAEDRLPSYAQIEHLADELPEKERAAVVLRYGYDLSLLGHRHRTRLQRGGCPPGRFLRCAAPAKEAAMIAVPKALDRRFREAATDAGLVDVSFDVADTQIGPLLLAVTERGLCRISFDPEPDRETETLARTFGVRVLRAPRELDSVRRELDEYFEGRRRDFDLPLDLRGREGFSRDILERLARCRTARSRPTSHWPSRPATPARPARSARS